MAKEKEDLRVRRTRKLLCSALFELMQHTPFDKLSVNDICKKAMVHRATFYNHFVDKNQLLSCALDEIQEHLYEKSTSKECYQTPTEMYSSLASNTIDFLDEHRENFASIFQNSPERVTSLILLSLRRSINYLIMKNKYKEEYKLPNRLIASFYAGGITTIGIEWLFAKNPYSKEEALKYINTLLDERPFLKNN